MTGISSDAMIAARGLTKYFGAFVAIKDISFSIPRGQIVAFVGPNGAGKSTTMKILSGFMAASEGSAYVAGMEITANRIGVCDTSTAPLTGSGPPNGWVICPKTDPCTRI